MNLYGATVRERFEDVADYIVSTTDIADACAVTVAAVSNWGVRWDDFPAPLLQSGTCSLYPIDEVHACLVAHGRKPDWSQ